MSDAQIYERLDELSNEFYEKMDQVYLDVKPFLTGEKQLEA